MYRGFTLTELLVVMAITLVIMVVVLFSYGNYTDSLTVSGAAQELSMAIRDAQTSALNVRENLAGAPAFPSYGIAFNPVVHPSTYYLYADRNSNGLYEPYDGCGTMNTECVQVVELRDGVTVSAVCDKDGVCPPIGVESLLVYFVRPRTDVYFSFLNDSGIPVSLGSAGTGARIRLSSSGGETEEVVVESVGRIDIQEL